MPRPTKAPLPCAVNKIHRQGNNRAQHKEPREKQKGNQQLLHEIDLQCHKGPKSDPQPLSGFLLVRFLRQITGIH